MSTRIILTLISIFGFSMLLLSCEKAPTISPCDNITCQNGGTCDEGICDCPPGTSGTFCEIVNPCFEMCQNNGICEDGACHCPEGFYGTYCELEYIQQQLDNGKNPLRILDEGYSLDSLFGKHFNGGLIFYVDLQNEIPGINGLLAAPEDTGDWDSWSPTLCNVTINGFNDWRLPNRVELNQMWENLRRIGCSTEPIPLPEEDHECVTAVGNFFMSEFPGQTDYYTSEEHEQDDGWTYRQNFNKGNQFAGYWPILARTRCIRAF